MAVIHKSYTFDAKRFHAVISQNAFINYHLDADRLLELARKVVANASVTVQQNLETLRFGSEWLDTSEDIARTYLWYLIVLSQELSPTASLSNRYLGSYSVLSLVLPLAGWDSSEIQKLISGRPLHTLPESLDEDFLSDERNFLDQYGGWLSLPEVKLLESRLRAAKNHFSSSATSSIDTLTKAASDVSAAYSLSAEERLEKAYADGINMLQEAMNKGEALFIILD